MSPCNSPSHIVPQNTNTPPPFQGRERVSLDLALAVPPWLPRIPRSHSVNGQHHCALDNGLQLPARLSFQLLLSSRVQRAAPEGFSAHFRRPALTILDSLRRVPALTRLHQRFFSDAMHPLCHGCEGVSRRIEGDGLTGADVSPVAPNRTSTADRRRHGQPGPS